MSKFIQVTYRAKPVKAQAFDAVMFTLSSDAILTYRLRAPNEYLINLKPEYENEVKESIARAKSLGDFTASEAEIKKLS